MNNKKQRNWLFTMLLLVMAILMPYEGAWAATSVTTSKPQGEGSSSNPFQISNAKELAWFRDWVNGTYTPKDGESASEHEKACAKLIADIDMSTVCGENIGSWSPIVGGYYSWCGTFDGNNKTIKNLYINSTESSQGLFGYISNTQHLSTYSCIKNIKFENVNITSTGSQTGALAAVVQDIDEVSNIHVLSGTITGKRSVGGIVGRSRRSKITNATNKATIINHGSDDTGGIAGSIGSSTLTSCANYGEIIDDKEESYYVGGITGSSQASSTISNCANYANIRGGYQVGGIVGKMKEGTLENSFTSGNITQIYKGRSDYPMLTSDLIVGYFEQGVTLNGKIIYNTNSTLTIAGSKATPKGIGYEKQVHSGSGELLAITPEELKTGKTAYTLQENVGDNQDIIWGQHLETDPYPIPGSTYQVYANSTKISCTGIPLATEYTNVKPSDVEAKTIVHGVYTYHAIKEPTCTQNGNIAYYECNDCHKSFSDQGLTKELSDIIGSQAALGHSYDKNDVCTRCHTSMPILTDDCWYKSVTQEKESKDLAAGYNLYKYIPLTDGDLTIVSSDSKKTLATLWDKEQVTCLASSDSGNPEKGYTHRVSKGKTYYIGIREIDGGHINNIILYVNLRDASLLGTGSAEEPFEIKTAEHLAWYRDYVNADNGIPSHHYNACAKLMDDIDLSPICHPADKSKNLKECSWMPIASNGAWGGIFDGQGHTISNLYINNNDQCTGFFGAINSYYSQRSIIKNIIFENVQVNFYTDNYSSQPVGVLASSCHCTDISNVQINSGYVKGMSRLGGVIGYARDCSLTSCQNKAEITGINSVVGGIIGWCQDSQIKKCINYGNITAHSECGGLFGRIESLQNNQILISYCANYGNIQGHMDVGGIIGRVLGASNVIDHVFVAGNVSKTAPNEDAYVGYLAGSIENATFSGKNIYNGETTTGNGKLISATTAIGNIVYKCEGQESIISLTTQQIKSGEATYKLNDGKSEGDDLAWYQAIGTDDYPVLTQKENGIVYYAHDFICAQNKYTDYVYRNEDSKTIHNMITGTELDADQHIYQTGCRREACEQHHYYADPNATLEAEKQSDGSFLVEQMALTDGEAYDSQAEFTAQQLSYTRSFAHDKWQALYVPFETKVTEELLNDFELAAPNNLHEYELADGSTKVVLEAKLMKSGYTIKAQRPYLIRAKEAGEKIIQLTDCPLKAAAEDSYVDCSSVLRHYKFIGTLKGKTSFDTSADFVLQQGLFLGTKTDTQLKAMRWYLNATDRDTDMGILPGSGNNGVDGGADGGNGSTQASRCINITIVDGDATTGIDELHVITEQTSGSKNGARLGIYDLQGRKLSQEPQNGVYIKDGKKVIK